MAIRFAPIIRVSTESQEAQGESLRTQRSQITNYVEKLGGDIPDLCWKYCGQEHATPGQERKYLDKLLEDSGKNIFDAVIVCDASRWSRDNSKSIEGLDTLKRNGIKFFVGCEEQDLYKPETHLILGMFTQINQFFAESQAKKSIENRIHRAKRGIPTAGKLPYGRTFNKNTVKWGIDQKKQEKILWAADQYITGKMSILEIAAALDMNGQALWKKLKERCGDKWDIKFFYPKFGIDETVTIKIPRLLPQETIDAINRKLEANRTYQHGQAFRKYLLGRMVFCEDCKCALVGDIHRSRRYQIYKHWKHQDKTRDCRYNTRWTIRADSIENIVISELFKLFGDVKAIEKAAKRAIPDLERVQSLRKQKENFQKELSDIAKAKDRIVKAIADGIMENVDAKHHMGKLKEQGRLLEEQIHKIDAEIENVPTEEEINNEAKFLQKVLTAKAKHPRRLTLMSWEDKRALCETVFAGKDIHGNRLGVYIRKEGKTIHYTIRGILNTNVTGSISPPDKTKDEENSVTRRAWY